MTAAPSAIDYLLITGASSGIGREIAVAFSGAHRLLLHGRDGDRLEATRHACAEPARHLLWRSDLENTAGIANSLGDMLSANQARIVGFVHCAALFKVLPLRNIDVEHALAVMNTNVLAALEIVRVLMRRPINADGLRSVVFISSIASQFGARGFSAYCASKAGLDGLMKALAIELAPAVRVNSVLPGGIRTPTTEQMYANPTLSERLTRDYPLGVGTPQDVAEAVAFLLSERARWITGQQLIVDGGRTANISA